MSEGKIKDFPPSGTRDFFPEDMLLKNWLFNKWSTTSRSFGFLEYDAPILEHAELWTKKSGSSDILNEMYAFEKDGIQLTLRPEMTPSLARMMLNYLPTAVFPVKLFSMCQCFRYENVSKGRRREFYQWNVDIFGGDPVKSEIDIFILIVKFLETVGLTSNDVVIRISNRMIIQKVLAGLEIKDDKFVTTCNIIDKIEKLTKEEISCMLKEQVGIDDKTVDIIYDLVSIKTIEGVQKYLSTNDEIYKQMDKIFTYANELGIGKWLQLDLSIVRGLNYYTGIVFEGYCRNTQIINRALFGGGQYDNLMESFGYSEPVAAIGFGMGDIVLIEILKELGKLPQLTLNVDYVVVPFNENYFTAACEVASKLRDKGKVVDVYSKPGKIKNAYSYADRKNANNVVFIAPTEWSNKQIVIKNLREKDPTKKQITVDLEQFVLSL